MVGRSHVPTTKMYQQYEFVNNVLCKSTYIVLLRFFFFSYTVFIYFTSQNRGSQAKCRRLRISRLA